MTPTGFSSGLFPGDSSFRSPTTQPSSLWQIGTIVSYARVMGGGVSGITQRGDVGVS